MHLQLPHVFLETEFGEKKNYNDGNLLSGRYNTRVIARYGHTERRPESVVYGGGGGREGHGVGV